MGGGRVGGGALFTGTDGGMREAEEGVAGAHHSQTRSGIPEGWGRTPIPLLLPLPPATRARLPPGTMTSSSKNKRSNDGREKKNRRRKTPAV